MTSLSENTTTRSFFWTCYAACYDGLLGTLPYRQLLDKTVASIPRDAATLLDAGCGTGNMLRAIRQSRGEIVLHGTDFSDGMLRRAKLKVRDAQLWPADLNARLPFADATFDVVTCINVLYAVVDPAQTLAELRRVLKPGGCLIASGPLARPKMSAFIKEQAAEAGWGSTIPLLLRLTSLLLFNVVIFQRGRAGQYHFLDLQSARTLLGCNKVTEAYANQNWFACTTNS